MRNYHIVLPHDGGLRFCHVGLVLRLTRLVGSDFRRHDFKLERTHARRNRGNRTLRMSRAGNIGYNDAGLYWLRCWADDLFPASRPIGELYAGIRHYLGVHRPRRDCFGVSRTSNPAGTSAGGAAISLTAQVNTTRQGCKAA